ncbi:Aste57867_24600 [Aphanomyces stellatus]|uniref:Aste57867_24600 protein n=1 Tax=Aphanomyces stellatus TaxID=120398 RepID=A0A485LQT0_9STRA|nr:hypothetical protein As57867_024522 [Aphanomyces stellatus]VFU01238.1 Aste57867_24600 [Aphanomyces stellatus]
MHFRSVHSIFVVLCLANVLSYIFRNLVPASPVELSAFIQHTLDVPSSRVSFYFGLLESVFIVTFSISIVVFGYLSKTIRPFQLLAIGLILWVVSSLLCGLAAPANNFYVLLIGRLLSGVGDSSIFATAPPFFERYASPDRKNLWMALFYGAIPVGTSLSYFLGSLVTRTLGWQWTFYIVAGFMTPLALLSLFCVPDDWNVPLGDVSTTPVTSFGMDMSTVVHSMVFLTSSLGGAAFAFTFVACATFVPAILIGAGTFSPASSATIFGLMVLVAGIAGSIIGGVLLDRASKDNDDHLRLAVACRQQLLLVALGLPFGLVSIYCLHAPVLFFILLTLALTLTFATLNATTVTILLSVPRALQGLAMGLFSNIVHWVGDVPAPLVVGLIKDSYAPGCGSLVDTQGVQHLDPACADASNFYGLKMTFFFSMAWLTWAVLLWLATWRFAIQHGCRSEDEKDIYVQMHEDDHTSVAAAAL